MEFRLLGPVEVDDAGRTVPLGPPRQRAVLAMLALAAPEVVSTDRFVDGLWGEDPPARPLPALQVFVHGLRRSLRGVSEEDLVERVGPGYRLRVDPTQVDVTVLRDRVARARALRAGGDLVGARRALDEARRLWRGPALADVAATPFAAAEIVRLEELRLEAEEEAHDVALGLGEHASLVGELEAAVQRHPMRERLWGQLMTALYRSDRQADALATYARARVRLAEELGVDPGRALQQLELAILRQDPTLAAPHAAPAPVATRTPARVPRPATATFGRDSLVDDVRALLAADAVRVVTLTGPGGAGKSRVAALAALAAGGADDFPGGVVYLAATERTEVDQLAREVALVAAGSDDEAALDDLAAPTLVVLDNLEALADGARLVQRLVERTAVVTVLATSRLPLRLRAEHVVAVPPLEVPAPGAPAAAVAASPAVAMFADRAAAASPDFRLADHLEDVGDLCRFLDGLPLAIELAAAQVGVVTPARIRRALEVDLSLLQARAIDVPDRQRTLTATLEWSYDRLPAPARTVLDRLALFERGFTIEAVEAVCDDVPDVLSALAALVEARLIRPLDARVQVRFVVLGTVRSFARSRPGAQEDLEERWAAHAGHLLDRARIWAGQLDGPEGTAALGRFQDTAADLDSAVDWALTRGRLSVAADLATTLTDLWIASGRLVEGLRRVSLLLAHGSLTGLQEADLRAGAGRLAYHLGDWDRAGQECRAVLAAPDAAPDALLAARCQLGAVLVVTGAAEEGARLAGEALEEAQRRERYPISAIALSVLAIARAVSGDLAGERALHERRLEVVGAHGDLARVSDTLNTLAEIALDEDDAATARAYAAESVAIAGQALPLECRDATISLARAAALEGAVDGCARHLADALVLADRTGQSLALAQCLRVGGSLAVLTGAPEAAVRAFSAAQVVSPSPSGTDEPMEADLARWLRRAQEELGEARARSAWVLGRTLPVRAARADLDERLASLSLSEH